MISRRQLWTQSIAVVVAFGLSCGWANAATTIVHPTGSFPLDPRNVQAAVDQGGTVLLKATDVTGHPMAFNFGPPDPAMGGGVAMTSDVTILGERVGPRMTRIDGGYHPFVGQVPVKTHIEGIDFEAPLAAPIILLASTGTEIIGNRINGVIGIRLRFGTDGDGIDLFGNDDPHNAITGHVRIADNVIENLGADFANGMQLDEVAADVEINGNTVRFPQSNGLVQTVGITAFRCHNRVSIVGNSVTMGPGNPDASPAPILIAGDLDAHYFVALNNLVSNHPNGDGIVVNGGDFTEPTKGAVIELNRITLNSSFAEQSGGSYFGFAGLDIFGAVNDSLIAGNVIRGTSAFAVSLGGFGDSADSDRLFWNDFSQHTSLTTDVYFDSFTSNMVLEGRCTSDIDQGVHNQINCAAGIGHLPAAAPMRRGADAHAHLRDVSRMNVQGALLDALRQWLPK